MEISLEFIIICLIILIFLGWAIWFRISLRFARKKYKKLNLDDGNEKRTTGRISGGPRDRKLEVTEPSSTGFTQPEERGVLQTTSPSLSGESSSSKRKTSKSPRGFFGKFRRK